MSVSMMGCLALSVAACDGGNGGGNGTGGQSSAGQPGTGGSSTGGTSTGGTSTGGTSTGGTSTGGSGGSATGGVDAGGAAGSGGGDTGEPGVPGTVPKWQTFCTALRVDGSCQTGSAEFQGTQLEGLTRSGSGWSGVRSTAPVTGHFEAEVKFDPRATEAGPVAFLLLRAGAAGAFDANAFSGVSLRLDAQGRPVFRVIDRQRKVNADSGCAVSSELGDDVWDKSCEITGDAATKRYEHVLSGEYVNQDKLNDFRVPFTKTNGRIKLFYDATTGFYRFYYGVMHRVLGESKYTEGWSEFLALPAPISGELAEAQHYLAVVAQPGSGAAPVQGVAYRKLPMEDAKASVFALAKRDFTWSGFTAPGVVVSLGNESPAPGKKLVFWEETHNVPVWALNDQALVTYEFIELWAKDRVKLPGCLEAMSDRLLWRNTVDVLEDNAARKVVRWTYYPLNPAYRSASNRLDSVPKAVETWTIYPDGTSYRNVEYTPDANAKTAMDDLFEWAEIMLIAGTRSTPESHAMQAEGKPASLQLADLSGQSIELGPQDGSNFGWGANPANKWKEVIALTKFRANPGENVLGPSPYAVFGQVNAETPKEVSGTSVMNFDVSWHDYKYRFTHWPVSKGPFQEHDKTFAVFDTGEVAHGSLISVQPRGGTNPAKKEWVSLVGLAAPGDLEGVKGRAATWLRPGSVTNASGCTFSSFDRRQGGAVLSTTGSACAFDWDVPSGEPTLVNPTLVIRGWKGSATVTVKAGGGAVAAGDVRSAKLASGDLVVWIAGEYSKKTRFEVSG
jgi:hypothetical protein